MIAQAILLLPERKSRLVNGADPEIFVSEPAKRLPGIQADIQVKGLRERDQISLKNPGSGQERLSHWGFSEVMNSSSFSAMFLLLPIQVNVLYPRWPIANLVLIVLNAGMMILDYYGFFSEETIELMVLNGWNPLGLVGHMFLHLDLSHLIGNLFALWLFGNAVCSRVGNGIYLFVYFLTGTLAGVAHNLFQGEPAIGASGAINGVIGLYLALYPLNKVNVFYLVFIKIGTFEIAGKWLLSLWFILDLWGGLSGQGDIAYWAHIGGFLVGLGFGLAALGREWVTLGESDNESLLEILAKRKRALPDKSSRMVAPPPEEKLFYLYTNDQQIGPYSRKTVLQLLEMQQVASTDLIYDEKTQSWVALDLFLRDPS